MAEREAPPAGEQIHMPGESLLPLLNAVGVTVALVGVTTAWWLVATGLTLFFVTTVLWVRSAVRDIGELPMHHDGH